jgi:hypothetical protein
MGRRCARLRSAAGLKHAYVAKGGSGAHRDRGGRRCAPPHWIERQTPTVPGSPSTSTLTATHAMPPPHESPAAHSSSEGAQAAASHALPNPSLSALVAVRGHVVVFEMVSALAQQCACPARQWEREPHERVRCVAATPHAIPPTVQNIPPSSPEQQMDVDPLQGLPAQIRDTPAAGGWGHAASPSCGCPASALVLPSALDAPSASLSSGLPASSTIAGGESSLLPKEPQAAAAKAVALPIARSSRLTRARATPLMLDEPSTSSRDASDQARSGSGARRVSSQLLS